MPRFRYMAVDAQGKLQRGHMEAADTASVIAALRRQGCLPMEAELAEQTSLWHRLLHAEFGRRQALLHQETADLTRELAVMLGAGQDLDGALRFLVETAPNERVRAVTTGLRDAVRDGSSLADALARHPQSFPPVHVGMVRAGEAGGKLAGALDHLASMLERQRALATAIRSALIYPALLVVGALGAIVLMLTEVLPQFTPLFEQSGARLPALTQALVDAGDLIGEHGVALLLSALAAWIAARLALRRAPVRLALDRLMPRLPLVGALTREVLAARLTRALGTLLVNGVPLVGALQIVQDLMGNRAASAAVAQASLSARGGAGLARALEAAALFPVRTIHLLRLGEENAQLGPMALRAADIHEERTRVGVQRMLTLLVPAITIVMGAAVATIVAALLLAMLSLNDLAA